MSERLTTAQLAARWGVAPGTVENWRHARKGPKFVKLHKGRNAPVVYRLEDVIAYEARQSVPTRDQK